MDIRGTNSDDFLFGTDGGDYIRGDDGFDVIFCGDYNDWAFGGDDTDWIFGEDGKDTLDGEDGDDVIYGGDERDWVYGGSGHDVLYGEEGDDELNGGTGADTMYGGIGDDHYVVDDVGDTVIENAGEGFDEVVTWISYMLPSSVEALTAGPVSRTILLVLTGNELDNTITGNDGNDTIDGGAGGDTMIGQWGNDTYIVDDARDLVIEDDNVWGGVYDQVKTSVSYTLGTWSGVEALMTTDPNGRLFINLTGNEFENTITGNAGNNIINGGAGADAMAGLRGNDTYVVDNAADFIWEDVGEGTDRVQTSVSYALMTGCAVEVLETTNARGLLALDLIGNEFDNTISGNDGQNNITGGLGRDTMTGNGGADTFTWASTAETGPTAATADVLTDFSHAKSGDLIALDLIDANTLTAGNQTFAFIAGSAFMAPGQVRAFTDGIDTFIALNTDKDVDPEAMIRVTGVHTVDASWFVL